MKAIELRIGNFVEFGKSRQKVREIGESWVRIGDCVCSIESVKPIPLTEELLLKFGFKYTNHYQYLKNGLSLNGTVAHFSFDYWRTGDQGKNNYFNEWIEIPKEVKYVHQLQNLYFSLIGEELKLQKYERTVSEINKEG